MTLTDLQKEYCVMNGWEKRKGIWIDNDMLTEDYDKTFFTDEQKEDLISEAEVWCHVEGDDVGVYEDDEIIEHIEDNFSDQTFEEWKKRKAGVQKR